MLDTTLTRGMADHELRDTASYFAQDAPFPYVSASIKAGVCAWLMSGHVSSAVVALWALLSVTAWVARDHFLRPWRDQMDSPVACRRILDIVALSSLSLGLTWGSFTGLYMDIDNTTSVLMAGSVVAGTVGSAAAPPAIFLPAYYLIVVPTVAPLIYLLLRSSQVEHWILAGLTLAFFLSTAGYAHISHRTHRETMRLRQENHRLIRDLQGRKTAAEDASQAKSLFLAGVSHDLKQPLRAIALFMGALRHRLIAQSEVEGVYITDKVGDALHCIQGQIARLLELFRLESGALDLQVGRVDLEDLFDDLHAMFGVQAQAKGVRLVFADVGARRRSHVCTDRHMLDSVLQNLISNALKYTDKGAVYVGTRLRAQYPEGSRLCIEVRDSGAGIPVQKQPLLFDAYRRFDDREGSDSHGLGLAIAKAQSSYMGCEIALASVPGQGSTFTLCGLASGPRAD